MSEFNHIEEPQKELNELNDWLAINLMGWSRCTHLHCSGFHDPNNNSAGKFPSFLCDGTALAEVLPKCLDKLNESENSIRIRKISNGEFEITSHAIRYYWEKKCAPSSTLGIAICKFAKMLFEKYPGK